MKVVSVDEAINHIKQSCIDSPSDDNLAKEIQGGREYPFFFMVGAGISFPPVPLASQIVDSCKAVATRLSRTNLPTALGIGEEYSHWFKRAYPQPKQRQRYLRQLMEKTNVSHANFRLARILLDGSITNLVITSNFDDFLSRALTMFGVRPIVCDHPSGIDRINLFQNDIQIVHIHGTYWFYDCCNLNDEIISRASPSNETTVTMAALLDNVLAHKSPIVIGYRGWENDVFMGALKRRIWKRRLPYIVYWFCYSETEIDAMPEWLRLHEDVVFVLHPKSATLVNESNDPKSPENYIDSPQTASIESLSPENEQVFLKADDVFDQFIIAFDIKPPKLVSNPLEFFKEQIEAFLPNRHIDIPELDLRQMESAIKRIERAIESEKSTAEARRLLKIIRSDFKDSKFSDVIYSLRQLEASRLSKSDRKSLVSLAFRAASGIGNDSVLEIEAYSITISLALAALSKEYDRNTQIYLVMAYINKTKTLKNIDRHEEAIDCIDELINNTHDKWTDNEIEVMLVNATYLKGSSLYHLDRHSEAISLFESLIAKYIDNIEYISNTTTNRGEYSIPKVIADCYIMKSNCERDSLNKKAAISSLESAMSLVRTLEGYEKASIASRAHINKALVHSIHDESDLAVENYKSALNFIDIGSNSFLDKQYGRSILLMSDELIKNHKTDEARQVLSSYLESFRDLPEDHQGSYYGRSLYMLRTINKQ